MVTQIKETPQNSGPQPIPEASPRQPPPTALNDENRSKTCYAGMALAGDEGHDGPITAGYRSFIVVVTLRQWAKNYRDTSKTDIGVGVISRL
jgi:hypothetical protein